MGFPQPLTCTLVPRVPIPNQGSYPGLTRALTPQKIAAENNLSETAYYVHKGGTSYNLRCEAHSTVRAPGRQRSEIQGANTLFWQRLRLIVAHFGSRWFTPTVEVNLCGHATMAAAHAIFTNSSSKPAGSVLHMETMSGMLTVTRNEDESFSMELPEWPQGENPSMIDVQPQPRPNRTRSTA